jgi:hypothetical protein
VAGFLVAVGVVLFLTNSAPAVPAISAADLAASRLPYVVKLHARWCPICMATKGAWADMERAYAGKAKFVVFDFTDRTTTEASRADAVRLGLTAVFENHEGETGTVLVVDGASKEERQVLHGFRRGTEYGAAIDAVIGSRHE